MAPSKPAEGITYTKPTTQLDLESFQAREAGKPDPQVGEPREYVVEGNDLDAFVGVNAEYANYAEETHKAFAAEGSGAEAKAEKKQVKAQAEAGGQTVLGGVVDEEKIKKANADLGGGSPEDSGSDDDDGKAPAPAKE